MTIHVLLIRFEGRGMPCDGANGFVVSEATGRLLGVIGEAEFGDAALTHPGPVEMRTRVFAKDGHFWEAGRISFADMDSHLEVETLEPAVVLTHADGSSRGTATWRILNGSGRFSGADGLVTGNFTADAAGVFVDHQLYKIVLPAATPRAGGGS